MVPVKKLSNSVRSIAAYDYDISEALGKKLNEIANDMEYIEDSIEDAIVISYESSLTSHQRMREMRSILHGSNEKTN